MMRGIERPTHYIEVDGVAIPCSMMDWARSGGKGDHWCVAKTYRGDGKAEVSTVFLGLDHAWDGPPMIYETMVFFAGDELDEECERYSTREEALKGHQAMVDRLDRALIARIA